MLYVNGSSTQPAKLDAANKQDLISHIYDNNRACWVLKFTSGKFAHILKTLVSNNTITSITLPEGLTSIEDEAFSGCNLTSITIPESVISIGKSAFSGCSNLLSVIIPNGVTSIGSSAFYECSNLKSIM